ncbi:hypothetical protein S245_057571, partial [Arachis hypogaea]|nr:LOB domain-containing protein 4-like [Arachis hypogaea]
MSPCLLCPHCPKKCPHCVKARSRCTENCPYRRFFPPEAEGSRTLYAILTEFFPPQCIKKFLSRDIVNRDEPTFKKHLLGLRWMALQWKKRPVNGPYGSYLKIKKKLRIAQKKLRRMRFMHQVHRMRPIRGVRSEP